MYLLLVFWCTMNFVICRVIEKQVPYTTIGTSDYSLDEFDTDVIAEHDPGASDSSSVNTISLTERTLYENLPVRSFMADPNIKWRYGKPDYSLVDAKYMAEKTMNHTAGSLEKIVENLVKTWEMESEHKGDKNDWGCVVPDEYHVTVNGHCKFNISDNIKMGNYNMLLMDSPLYNANNETRSSSLKTFKTAFPGAFAWEVLEVTSGPPNVTFSWHHWAEWTGPYKNVSSTGERIHLYGSCNATVTDDLKITDLQVFYESCYFLAKLRRMEVRTACLRGMEVETACPHMQ